MQRILVFHHYNSAIGAGLCLLHIVESLKMDYQIAVVLPKGGDLPNKLKAIGIETYETDGDPVAYQHYNGSTTNFFSLRYLKNILQINHSISRIAQYIDDYRPDIIAVNSMTLFWIGKIAHSKGIKAICFHRETYKHSMFGLRTQYMKKHIREDFEAVVYISNYDLKATGKTDHLAVRITDKVALNKYHTDRNKDYWRKKLNLPIGGKLILYCGGCSKLKGGLTAVSALKDVENRNLRLVFLQYKKAVLPQTIKQRIRVLLKRILRKDYQYLIEKKICNAHLENRVIFRSSTDSVEQYFLACDAVVFPSHLAHQARPIYEAGAARIPIFISDFPNTREFATEKNAYLFKPDDSKALADRINEWINNLDEATKRIKLNEVMTLKNHDLTQLHDQLSSLLNKL